MLHLRLISFQSEIINSAAENSIYQSKIINNLHKNSVKQFEWA